MTTPTTQAAGAATDPTPLFEPFEWVARRHRKGPYELLSNTRDLAGGACLIMQMIEQSVNDVDNDEPPMFNRYNQGRLLRMAIAAIEIIEVRTAEYLDKMQEEGEKAAGRAAESGGAR